MLIIYTKYYSFNSILHIDVLYNTRSRRPDPIEYISYSMASKIFEASLEKSLKVYYSSSSILLLLLLHYLYLGLYMSYNIRRILFVIQYTSTTICVLYIILLYVLYMSYIYIYIYIFIYIYLRKIYP